MHKPGGGVVGTYNAECVGAVQELAQEAPVVYIASHAFGQGAVIWVFISGVFPNRVRARGQTLGSFTHWFMAAAVSWTCKPIAGGLGGRPVFAVYAVMMGLQLLWVLFMIPETKGVPLEEIQRELGIE